MLGAKSLGPTRTACGDDVVDASILLLAYHRFEDASSDRMQQSHARIRQRLVSATGLVHRNEQVKSTGRRVRPVQFWETDFLAHCGRADEAHEVYEAVLTFANDVGLFRRRKSIRKWRCVGNFSASIHASGVINAASHCVTSRSEHSMRRT